MIKEEKGITFGFQFEIDLIYCLTSVIAICCIMIKPQGVETLGCYRFCGGRYEELRGVGRFPGNIQSREFDNGIGGIVQLYPSSIIERWIHKLIGIADLYLVDNKAGSVGEISCFFSLFNKGIICNLERSIELFCEILIRSAQILIVYIQKVGSNFTQL